MHQVANLGGHPIYFQVNVAGTARCLRCFLAGWGPSCRRPTARPSFKSAGSFFFSVRTNIFPFGKPVFGEFLSFFNVQCLSDTIPSIVLPCLDKAPLLYCPRSNPIKLNNGACLGFYFIETFWFPWEINLLCRNQS